MPASPAAHGWEMMTTGQGASQATWLLTEPTPRWPRPPLPREPTTSRSASCPAHVLAVAGLPPGDDAAPSMNRFRIAGTYGVEVAPGQDPALMLAVTAVLDQMAHQER